jgi:hypothetical protein
MLGLLDDIIEDMKHRNFYRRAFCFVASVLCFVAHFAAPAATLSSFPATYNGLAFEGDATLPQHTGYFRLDVSRSGHFTGKLFLGRNRASFGGRFDDSGKSFVRVWLGTGDYELVENPDGSTDYREIKKMKWTLALQLTNSVDEVAGQIFAFLGSGWSGIVQGQRAGYSARANPAPQAGRYTFALPGSPDGQTAPGGYAWGTLTVDDAGHVRVQGGLPDNSRFTATSILTTDGVWPLFTPLNQGRGMLVGWLQFTNSPDSELVGPLNWVRLRTPDATFYRQGFTNQSSVVGSSYVRPTAGQSVLNLTNPVVTLSGGELTSSFTNSLTVSTPSVLKGSADSRAFIQFSSPTGLFVGWTQVPGTERFLHFNGVVLQNQNAGFGYFTDSRSGSVTIEEQP